MTTAGPTDAATPGAEGESRASVVREHTMSAADWKRLRGLAWGKPLDTWPEHGVVPLTIRRGESRHPVLFVEREGRRYALKETSPVAARREIGALDQLQGRRTRTIAPVGVVIVRGDPLPVGEVGGQTAYVDGDIGYCVTRLAEHVLPQSILYRYPFTDENKRLLWNAVVELLVSLHESGVYWGDPSLANVLIDLSDRRLVAVMADAETAEIMPAPLAEGLRRQDLDAFVESLEWQTEDIRLARGLPEDRHLVTGGDTEYILSRYAGLRAEREAEAEAEAATTTFARLVDMQRRVRMLSSLGYGVLDFAARVPSRVRHPRHPHLTLHGLGQALTPSSVAARRHELEVATLRPGWYAQHIHELLDVRVPARYAARIYEHLNVHKWLLSERAQTDVGMEAAAQDWREHYHLPLMAFLASYLPDADPTTFYATYAAILDWAWELSVREGRTVSIEEAAMDYALTRTRDAE